MRTLIQGMAMREDEAGTGGPRNMGRIAAAFLLAGLAMGCGAGGGSQTGEAADTLTRRQKDSLISTMPVPGAGVVGKALRAADSASARAQRHDTLLR